jgi:centromeric protein E
MNASKMVAKKYGDNQGEAASRAITEDVEKEWMSRVEEEVKKREESERWAEELVGQLEREKQVSVL